MTIEDSVEAETTHFRTCPLCEATCGLEITTKAGAITRIRGDREDVFSKGFICPKGSTLKQLHADPDRVRTPLIKRNGQFEPATWEEAFAEIESRLGHIWDGGTRNNVGLYLGNPSAHTVAGTMFGKPLIQALKTQNLFSASTVDQMPKHVSSGLMFGNPGAMPVPDLDRTDYLLMLGANPSESNGSLCTAPDFPARLEAIAARGTLVVVDPRRTKSALLATEHITIRPGTDALWLAALLNVILTEELGRFSPENPDPVTGVRFSQVEQLAERVAPFTPEAVAAHCRVDPGVTRRIAHELAAAPTAAVYGRIGVHTTEFGTMASWLTDVLNIVTGNLDSPGGAMFPSPAFARDARGRSGGGRGFVTGRWSSAVSGHPEVRGELPVAALAEEIEQTGPDRIRALITNSGNPVRSCPDSTRLDAALGSLEFMVSIDIYINETTRHADVLLPSPSPLAKPHFDFAFYGLSVRNVVNYSAPLHPATDPTEPGMDEHEILARLALIASGMGATAEPSLLYSLMFDEVCRSAGLEPESVLAELSHLGPVERIIDVMLRSGPYDGLSMQRLLDSPHGIDLGPLEPRCNEILRTASGAVEVAPAVMLADLGRLEDLLNSPPSTDLLLVGRRHLRSNNSWMHNLSVLTKGANRCTLQVHPADAARLGIVDAPTAEIATAAGRCIAELEVTDEVAQGTVSLPHGWGHEHPEVWGEIARATVGVNSNQLTDDAHIDPISGNARLNAIPCTVGPALG